VTSRLFWDQGAFVLDGDCADLRGMSGELANEERF
jgi:hypothetical protein